MAKKSIKGMSPEQLNDLLNDGTLNKYYYKITAKDSFAGEPGESRLNPKEFLNQYKTWDNSEKEQIEILLRLIKEHVKLKTIRQFKKDRGGYFSIFSVSNFKDELVFKVYGTIAFLNLLGCQYFDGAYDIPDFTLEELYQEALKME